MNDFGGIATWEMIYNNIEKYYSDAKKMKDWKEGIRGVLYRDMGKGKDYFKKIDGGTFALKDYDENKLYIKNFKYKKTDKEIITKTRIGQGVYREKLLKKLKKCPITRIDEEKNFSSKPY